MVRLIINADDLGYSPERDEGIVSQCSFLSFTPSFRLPLGSQHPHLLHVPLPHSSGALRKGS
jgi:hypothetical protein